MAGVDVGGMGGKKRATNSDINMVPFIDLLMCTIAFLLITAVWVTNSRIPADAQVPGPPSCNGDDCRPPVERMLHLSVVEDGFKLTWKREGTVVSETFVPRAPVEVGFDSEKVVRYPELARALEREWGQYREHHDVADRKQDQIVLHSDDKTPFRELVAVLDAANTTRRQVRAGNGTTRDVSVFNTTFAVR